MLIESIKVCKMFKTLIDGCEPTRGSKYSACVDLYASEDVTIGAGETKLIGLGVTIDEEALLSAVNLKLANEIGLNNANFQDNTERAVERFKNSHYLQLMLRSSLSKELVIANGVGVIDLDYEDEIKIRLHNPFQPILLDGEILGYKEGFEIKKSQKIAQITLLEHKSYLFGIDTDNERNGGFGSTGA